MAESYIVPPINVEDDALRVFYDQICEKLNIGITDTSGLEDSVSDIDDSLGGDSLPDDVVGVIATGGYANIRLTFTQPSYNGHSYTVFVRSTDGIIGNAIAVGTTSTDVFIDAITAPDSTATYTYWAKNVNVYGVDSLNYSSPASALLGVDFKYSTDLLAGKLGYDEFDSASGVYPVRTEDVLPTLPDALYPLSSLILLTTNGKLYRNVGGLWSAEIPLTDVTGTGDLAAQSRVDLLYDNGADVTGDNTANDTSNVNGVSSATITSDLTQALSDAANAQSTADGKIESFFQDAEPTTGMSLGDLWFDTNDGNKIYRYSGTAWVRSQDDAIGTALANASTAQDTADGKVTTFYSTTTPTAEGEGDLWFNSTTGLVKRWTGTVWVEYASYNTGDLADLNTVNENYITNNAIRANHILAGEIIAGKIAAGALVVDDAVMQNGYIKSALIDSAEINTAQIFYIDADRIKAGSIDVVLTLTATTIEAGILNGGTITGSTIQSGTNVGGISGDMSGIKMIGDTLYVYDAAGNVRVKLGDLS